MHSLKPILWFPQPRPHLRLLFSPLHLAEQIPGGLDTATSQPGVAEEPISHLRTPPAALPPSPLQPDASPQLIHISKITRSEGGKAF